MFTNAISKILILLFCILFPVNVSASVLSVKAASMSTGTFSQVTGSAGYDFNGTSGSIFVPFPEGPGCGTGDYILQYAGSGAYDPSHGVIRFFGFSHGNDDCEAARFVRYTIATDTWDKSLAMPSAFTCLRGFSSPLVACLSHDWDSMNAVRATDGLQLAMFGTQAAQYNAGTNAWSAAGPSGQIHRNSESSFKYHPAMGKWMFCDSDYGCWSLDPASNFANGYTYLACATICWTGSPPYSIAESGVHNGVIMAYSNVNNVMYVMTGGTRLMKISSTGVFTQLANCPVQCSLTTADAVVDPVSGDLILLGGNNVMYAYNATANTWGATGVTVPAVLGADTRFPFTNGPGDGLIGVALPDLGVIWYAKYIGPSSNGVWLYKHGASTPDTTAPTNPTGLSATTVSSTQIDLAWTASTDAGSGVNYYSIEQCTGGSCSPTVEAAQSVTNSKSITGLTASTTYRWRIRTFDVAGNPSGYTLTVSGTTSAGGSTPVDFNTRCAAAGVVKCFNFDSNAQLGTTGGATGPYANIGSFHNNENACNTVPGTDDCPTIDTSIKSSGAGSMKFVMPVGKGADWGGQWFGNFSTGNTIQFGAGQDFYIQWRQRFSTEYVTNEWTDALGAYPKLAIVTLGDLPGCNVSNTSLCRGSNPGTAKIVFEDSKKLHYPMLYGPGSGDDPYQDFVTGGMGFDDFRPQNARPNPGCWNYWYNTPSPGTCFRYSANEWMTFVLHVHLGNLSGGFWVNSLVEMRMGREGLATEPVVSILHDIATNGEKFGKIWLLPYMTGKGGTDNTSPQATTWYDDLIISTLPIADPSGTTPTTLAAPTSVAVSIP